MKAEVTDLGPVKKSLSVEADPDDVRLETDQVIRRWASQVRIPGFRQGKAPIDLVRRRFAKEIDEEVRERVVARLYRQATEDHGLKPLGDPVLDELHHDEGQPLRFKTTFEVLPRFEVKDYKGVEVRLAPGRVEDKDVDEALESLRQSQAKYVTEEGRPSGVGDVIVADVLESPEGGEPRNRERVMIEVGVPDQLPAFNDAITGAAAGARLDFAVDYPEGHPAERLSGRTVRYAITVHEVKRQVTPALDDEFAKDLGDFENLEALRNRVRADLEARRQAEAGRAMRQSLLDKVLLANAIPLPELLVEDEIQSQLEDLARSMILHGVDPRSDQIDWKGLRDRQADQARKSVHARLVLDAIAEAESIAVSDAEVRERIRVEARRIGETEEALRARLHKGGGAEALRAQMVREKSLDFLVSVGNIQHAE